MPDGDGGTGSQSRPESTCVQPLFPVRPLGTYFSISPVAPCLDSRRHLTLVVPDDDMVKRRRDEKLSQPVERSQCNRPWSYNIHNSVGEPFLTTPNRLLIFGLMTGASEMVLDRKVTSPLEV